MWSWSWRRPTRNHPWTWCRIYHHGVRTPDGVTHRPFGPLHRLDHHTPNLPPQVCPDGRSVLYVAGNIVTAVGEVFGDRAEARICPQYRIAIVRPRKAIDLLDLRGQGTAMSIGALPSLATGSYPRVQTQQWARAIFEDQPVAETTVQGVYYDAAHTNGPAVALWNAAGNVEVLAEAEQVQDFALTDQQIWTRIASAAESIRLRYERVPRCADCTSS